METASDIGATNQERLDRISAEIARKITDLEPTHFSTLIKAIKGLNYNNPSLMEAVLSQLQLKQKLLEDGQYIDLMATFVDSGMPLTAQMLQGLQKRLSTQEQIEELDNEQVAQLIWVLTGCNYYAKQLLDFAVNSLSKMKLPKLSASFSSKVLFGLAHLDYSSEMSNLIVPILRSWAIQSVKEMEAEDIVRLMWSLAVLELVKNKQGWDQILKQFGKLEYEPKKQEALLLYQTNVICKWQGTDFFVLESLSDDARIRIAEAGRQFENTAIDQQFKKAVQSSLMNAGCVVREESVTDKGLFVDLEVDPKIAVSLVDRNMLSESDQEPKLLGWFRTKQILLQNEGWKILQVRGRTMRLHNLRCNSY
eukprot:TRINITY_DN9070_c0_g1_i1.p1 TRINITY_DN9070_c0_g1~~TRINITY_DN9070_c0_g1_i1.p1  ORF type:complete len:365 (-),score=54.94 TRINITY_DN9070_c0_g1_i1:86-1180(-)